MGYAGAPRERGRLYGGGGGGEAGCGVSASAWRRQVVVLVVVVDGEEVDEGAKQALAIIRGLSARPWRARARVPPLLSPAVVVVR